MKLLGIHGQQGKPNVVDIRNGSSGPVFEHIPHFELFVIQTLIFPVGVGSSFPEK
jgi:hypothetical protein